MAARVLALTLLALGLVAPCLEAQERQLVVDSAGTVYRLHQGAYGELFPDGAAAPAENRVLALDVLHAGGEAERQLVPGTESDDPESAASLVYEKGNGTVYLLWQTSFNGLHPVFQLTSFDGAVWSELIEVAYGPFLRKGSPKIAVTRDATADGSVRTLLQLIWWEEAPGATSRKRYAPIFLEGNGHSGSPPVIDLSSFLPAGDVSPLPSAAGLEDALALRAGRNARSVVVGFLDPDSHRLVTLEVELLPRELNALADKVGTHIVIVGEKSLTTREGLAQSARAKLLELATGFHEAARGFLADEVEEAVTTSTEDLTSPEGIRSIADKVGTQIVIVGARFRAAGLKETGTPEILSIPSSAGGSHAIRMSVISNRPAPEVSAPAELFLSESGRNAIVIWEKDGRIQYRESLDQGWSETGVIELTEGLDRAAVHRMLAERVRND